MSIIRMALVVAILATISFAQQQQQVICQSADIVGVHVQWCNLGNNQTLFNATTNFAAQNYNGSNVTVDANDCWFAVGKPPKHFSIY